MSFQSQVNNAALSKLPKVYAAIQAADQFDSSQMQSRALRTIQGCDPILDNMDSEQISAMDENLIESFKHNGWM